MGTTMVAFNGTPASAALTTINPITDQTITISNNNSIVIPPGMNYLVGAYFNGVHITRAQVQSPQLRELLQQEMIPVDTSATPTSPSVYIDMRDDPRIFKAGEAAQVQVIDATASENANGILILADGPITPVNRPEVATGRFTGSTTLTAYAWTTVALTTDQNIPSGTFELLGFRARSTGLIAARVIFFNQIWRPGVIGVTAVQNLQHPCFRRGGMGVLGTFTNLQIPQIEVFSSSADTSEVFEFDIHQISDSPTGF